MSHELPEGWARARVGDVFSCFGGLTPSTAEKRYWGGDIPWVSSKDVKGLRVNSGTEFVTDVALRETRLRRCRAGSVLVVVRSGVLAHTLPAAIAGNEVVVNQDLKVLDSGNDTLNQWFALFLKAHQREILDANRKDGTTVQSVRVDELLGREMPIPPLAEQCRIIENVEGLLLQVNTARSRLSKLPRTLKRLRQSVLAAAVSGRLTQQWRGTNDTAAPDPGNVLGDTDLPQIPSTWRWWRLPDLGELGRGKSKHRPRNDPKLYGGRYPFIQTGDVARCNGRVRSHSQTYNDMGLAQSRLWPAGTVCITIAANIAESAILTYSACFPDSVVGLVADPRLCLPKYVEFFVRTARDDLSQYAPATAQKNINLEILSDVRVPLPPLSEQELIVARVEELLEFAERIEDRADRATRRVEQAAKAILTRAFAGELVPTEAELARVEARDFECAAELLARVCRGPSGDHGSRRAASRRGTRTAVARRPSRRKKTVR
jgi:type I restriction enzyme S subunit